MTRKYSQVSLLAHRWHIGATSVRFGLVFGEADPRYFGVGVGDAEDDAVRHGHVRFVLCLYRSEDAANYVSATEGLDLLYAHRPLARQLLAEAMQRDTPMGRMRIISVDPGAKAVPNAGDAITVLAREAGMPFQLPTDCVSGFDPIAEWLSLMEVVQMLCPVWPVREKPLQGDQWRL